jgi:mRNA interferase MazF
MQEGVGLGRIIEMRWSSAVFIINSNAPMYFLMAITSHVRPSQQFGECLLQEWLQAGLLKPSVLKPLIATLQQNQVVKVMGQLSMTEQNGLQNVLQDILYC